MGHRKAQIHIKNIYMSKCDVMHVYVFFFYKSLNNFISHIPSTHRSELVFMSVLVP